MSAGGLPTAADALALRVLARGKAGLLRVGPVVAYAAPGLADCDQRVAVGAALDDLGDIRLRSAVSRVALVVAPQRQASDQER